jgi:hypothetical protein
MQLISDSLKECMNKCDNFKKCRLSPNFINLLSFNKRPKECSLRPELAVTGEPKKQPQNDRCKFAIKDCCGKPPICSVDGGVCENSFNAQCQKNPENRILPT